MPTPQRLPIVNSDDGQWGDILNQWLKKEHYDDGTDNSVNGGHKTITIRAGTASAGTAPLKLTSGTLLSSPEAGAIEFNSDRLYFTQTTSTTRKVIAAFNDASGATGDVYYRDSSGHFTRLGIGSGSDVLTVSGGLPSWQAPSWQASDSDLTAIAGLSPNNDDIIQRKSGAWTNRTIAQLKTDLNYEARTTFSDAPYTIAATERYVAQTGTMTSNRTVSLPAANAISAGATIIVADESGTITSSNFLLIAAVGSDTMIDGFLGKSAFLLVPYEVVLLRSDGVSKWTFTRIAHNSIANSGSTVVNNLAMYTTTGGTTLADSGVAVDTDTALTANSDAKLATQKAVKAFVTSGSVTMTNKTLTTPGISYSTVTKTGNYTATSSDTVILADATSNSVTITLPQASTVSGYWYYIKRIDSVVANTVSIARTNADTIDGATSQSIDAQYTSLTVVSNGSNWYII